MVEQPVGIPDALVAWDQQADRWLVRRADRSWLVRRWNWGERRRLLRWAARSGRLDTERFVAGLLDLLVKAGEADAAVDARPERGRAASRSSSEAPVVTRSDGEERDWLASVTLELLGVLPDTRVVPLVDAELAAARVLGWGPFELDRQPLPATDELLAELFEPAGAPVDDSWTRIVVDDG